MPSLLPSAERPRRVAVLGSTGSIGTSTLDVARHLPDRLELAGLAAHSKWEQLAEQCRAFKPRFAVICDPDGVQAGRPRVLPAGNRTPRAAGRRRATARRPRRTWMWCVSAVVGAAGLAGTWAALEAGKTVALANKETLVVGGPLVMDLAAKRGAKLLPVDSEHSAIFQALTGHTAADVDAGRAHRQRRAVPRETRGGTRNVSRPSRR